MEVTPVLSQSSEDSGCVSGSIGSFSKSSLLFESTPKDGLFTPNLSDISRKRKCIHNARKLQDVIESCPSTPKFSSTLNESLLNNLERCHLETNFQFEHGFLNQPNKYFKGNTSRIGLQSAPATPEKQISCAEDLKKSKIIAYSNSKLMLESPVKETHDILYANLKSKPYKKPFSPQKFKENVESRSPVKKCLFEPCYLKPTRRFDEIICNSVVMTTILQYLSDGDLYRLSLTSTLFKEAVIRDHFAKQRYTYYLEVHRENKENYKITPPTSPEKCASPPGSPSNRNFNHYYMIGKLLEKDQQLVKCPKCGKPSIVERNIGQCQNTSCGYIHCRKCLSCSTTGPDHFYDKCQSSRLMNQVRYRLSDLSNGKISEFQMETDQIFPSLGRSPNRSLNDSSGFYSDNEQPQPKVKQNLIRVFDRSTVLNPSSSNIMPNCQPKRRLSTQRRSSIVIPVLPVDDKPLVDIDPPSPPRVKNIACSKQSKRNLKRLTR